MTTIAALLGYPLGHTKSPAMHSAAFAACGIDGCYEVWETQAPDLPARLALLRKPGYYGANVTLPYKLAVLPLLDQVTSQAAQIGAVNLIVREADGRLTGDNTDAPAFLAALREDANYEPAGQRVLVLGASGAARAAVAALLEAEAAAITVVNRTLETAETLLGDALLGAIYDPELYALAADDPALAAAAAEASLIVNATSLGWAGDATPLDGSLITPGTLVYDMVYRPTQLLHEAAARGARTHDGLSMLARQAALAFERWTGQPVAVSVMLAAAGG